MIFFSIYRNSNMLKLKRQFSLLSLLVLVVQLFAQGPNGSGTYYRNANGQKGKSLKTALFQIISTHKDIGYKGLYDCYKKTDKRADGKVWDMYSNTTNYSFSDNNGGYKKEGDMYNREHSLPQSWFKEASPMKADIVHVVPTDGYVNNRRGSWPFGETNNPTYSSNNGFSKVGPSSVEGYSGTVFEPNDEYKGDFARISLTNKVVEKYAALTEDEIRTLVVERKWLATVIGGCMALMQSVTHRIGIEVASLVERYENTPPELTKEVREYESEVNG